MNQVHWPLTVPGKKSVTAAGAAGKIAILCHAHPSISKGGSEIAAYSLFQGLLALGVDVLFIAACPAADQHRLWLQSARERAVFYDPALYDHFYHLASPALTGQIVKLLLEEGVDVVNFHHFYVFGSNTLSAVAELGLRNILTLHEFLAICHHNGQMVSRPARVLCETASPQACHGCFPDHTRQQFALRDAYLHDVFARVSAFVTPSHFLADRYVKWGLPARRLAVIENGLFARPTPSKRPTRHSGGSWSFGFFGQINPFKGVETILAAATMISEDPALAGRTQIRLHGNITGQSEKFRTQLHETVDRLDFVTYLGIYDNAAVGGLMSACDYILVPSTWWENSPLVIQEAYAAGRPVICTGIGGMAEKVRDGISGLHFALGDPGSLVRAMAAAADPAVFERLSKGLPETISSTDMAEAYLALYADDPVAGLVHSD